MHKRKAIGKRLRFSVFHRDRFTCKYCGSRPPDVVLVADHVIPVADGGETTFENLATSCESCNQGKSDSLLVNRPPAADTDLLWLEAQQEIAEIKMAQKAVVARNEAMASLIDTLQDTWQDITCEDWCPADELLRSMLSRYSPEIVSQAIMVVAPKVRNGKFTKGSSRWARYMWGVLRNLAEVREDT